MLRPLATFDQIAQSVGKCFRLLERPRAAGWTVFTLLAIHTGLLAYSAYVHSPTLNEPGHLVAGLSHWKFGRFELYRVNPPLVRMVAALPVMAVGYEEDWSGFHEGPGARPVFGMGINFVRANSERSFFLFMIARWACIPFSWLGAVVCYLWARDLSGRPSGVMACTLWCFSPNILAHASLITADVGGTALGVAACYTFWRWLKRPTWTQAALTGCVLGLAELCKTTLILFYPLWPLLWVAYRWSDRREMVRSDWTREAGMLLLRMAIGIYVLNMGYGFEGSGKQLGEFHFVSNLFTGQELKVEERESDNKATSASSTNRFAVNWLGHLPVPFPKNYLLGIDIQQRDFENYGRPSYLRGEWQDHGWWYYYLYAGLIKIPIATLLLLGVTAILMPLFSSRPGTHASSANIPRWKDLLVLLTPPLVIFCVVSSKTGFSEHFRYVLPCFPFLFIWISRVATRRTAYAPQANWKFLDRFRVNSYILGVAGSRTRNLFAGTATLILLLWSFASSLWIYPHSLSYFNESIGGPLNGAGHLLGSNVDWGQDIRYLGAWIDSNAGDGPVYISYYSYLDPLDLGIPMSGLVPHGDSIQVVKTPEAWCAVSSDLLRGCFWTATAKNGESVQYHRAYFSDFRDVEPAAYGGYSFPLFGVTLAAKEKEAETSDIGGRVLDSLNGGLQ